MSFIACKDYRAVINRNNISLIFINTEKMAVYASLEPHTLIHGEIHGNRASLDRNSIDMLLADTGIYNNLTITRMFFAAAILSEKSYIILNERFVTKFIHDYTRKHEAWSIETYARWLNEKIPNYKNITDTEWLYRFSELSPVID